MWTGTRLLVLVLDTTNPSEDHFLYYTREQRSDDLSGFTER